MAKRRKLEAPSTEDLSRIEAEFEREAARGPMSAPIAQVAAETASLHDTRTAEERAAAAQDRGDAARLRQAEAEGLVMQEIPLEEICPDAIVRDRVVVDAQELEELKMSILKGGLRLPIEIFPLDGPPHRYGLLSGYRRLLAMQWLCDYFHGERFATIKAVIRDPEAMGGTFAAMVEENEIRSGLSHFERGRIAVVAAQQGAFVNTEEAVNALFAQASKAKRSKIRSFALIFEELGDLLAYPETLTEKDGLRVAAALRDGSEGALRDVLADGRPQSPEEEAALIAGALEGLATKKNPARGGRPAKAPPPRNLETGVRLEAGEDARGWYIRLSGRAVTRDAVDTALLQLERLFGPRDR